MEIKFLVRNNGVLARASASILNWIKTIRHCDNLQQLQFADFGQFTVRCCWEKLTRNSRAQGSMPGHYHIFE